MLRFLVLAATSLLISSVSADTNDPPTKCLDGILKKCRSEFLPTGYQEEYDKLNGWIQREFPERDIGYLTYLNAMKAEREAKRFEDRMASAVERVSELEQTVGDLKCTETSVRILDENVRNTRDKARDKTPQRPIDSLVSGFVKKHAEICKNVYHERFSQLAGSRRALIRKAAAFMDAQVGSGMVYDRTMKESAYRFRLLSAPVQRLVVAYLRQRATREEDLVALYRGPSIESSRSRLDTIGAMYDTSIANPCKIYYEQFRSVLNPCLYDARYAQAQYDSRKDKDFLHGLATFGMCKTMIQDRDLILKKVMEHLEVY